MLVVRSIEDGRLLNAWVKRGPQSVIKAHQKLADETLNCPCILGTGAVVAGALNHAVILVLSALRLLSCLVGRLLMLGVRTEARASKGLELARSGSIHCCARHAPRRVSQRGKPEVSTNQRHIAHRCQVDARLIMPLDRASTADGREDVARRRGDQAGFRARGLIGPGRSAEVVHMTA
ncbi:hypothetical protein BDP67DRAFT_496267 [Colletotrichum lupini]|nr:hypothetical protein BDP67DRAFT_496267 [Colletotrichum lupini]